MTRSERLARWTLRREPRGWEAPALLGFALFWLISGVLKGSFEQAAFQYVLGILFVGVALNVYLRSGYRSLVVGLEAQVAELRAPHGGA